MAKGKSSGKAADEGDGKPSTWVEEADRNQMIVAAKARGMGWSEIATQHDLSVRRCQKIVQEWRESEPRLRNQDPLEIVDELIEGYLADISELVGIGLEADNASARVGAVNARANIRTKVTELLQATGVLPNDLGQLHVEIDARFVAQQVVAVLNRHEISPEIKAEIAEALKAGPKSEPPALEAVV